MEKSSVPSASDQDDMEEKVQAGHEAPSTDQAPETVRKQKALGIVMISHLSEPPIHIEDGDGGNPHNWASRTKVVISTFVVLAGFVANFGIPVYIADIPSIIVKFHVGTTQAILPGSLYPYGLGVGAFISSAVSEIFGRSIVYKITLPLCLVFTILGGAAHNYSTLAAARFLAGTMAGPCLTVGVGIMNDIWNISLEKAGTTFAALYALLLVYATQVGPMAGGSIITHHLWRWSFWVTSILVGILALSSFLLPETHAPQILRKRAKKENLPVPKRGELLEVFLVSIGRPFHMIIVEPLVLLSGLVLALTQSIVFTYYVTYAILFEQVYSFTPYQVGMTFAPLLIGSVIAVPILGAFDRMTYQKARVVAIRSGTEVKPEKRLYPAMLSAFLLPISLFWLAWTGRPSIHWIVPALSGALFGIAYVLNMICIAIYNNDVYAAHYSASAFAATTFLRFTISSSFPLFAPHMVQTLGFAWATSLLGFLTIAMIPIPWAFFKWGPVLIAKSRYLQI